MNRHSSPYQPPLQPPLRSGKLFARTLAGLPPLEGAAIEIQFRADLRAHRGQLLSGPGAGDAVHAGGFLRRRVIVLDSALKSDEAEFRRILLHELFHFAWLRLGNIRRRSYGVLLEEELAHRARGEMGWSAERRKDGLAPGDRQSRRWREYVCESFCDTGAAVAGGFAGHAEVTLARRYRKRRAEWFGIILRAPRILV